MEVEDKVKYYGITFRNLIIGIGILILTMFVVIYGIGVFYPSVDYEAYCGRDLYLMNTESECINAGGVWQAAELKAGGEEIVPEGMCQANPSCYEKYDAASAERSKNVFIIAVPLGLILIALGAFIFHLNAVGLGVMAGGIGALIYGAGGYWQYADNLFKFIISLIGLVVLIFLAYWFNKRGQRKK
jgi:hypothetical protein